MIDSASTAGLSSSGLTLDFEPKFTTVSRGRVPTTLEWKDITYKVGSKQILHGLSGQAFPGDVVALMGPSGAGKSTLLNALAGRIVNGGKHHLTGDLFVNGAKTAPSAFRKRVAYVMQSDALTPTATAREALEMSAKLRLPTSITDKQRAELVDDIIDSLGLTKVQHSLIGNQMIRGLSGGERKRVSIGVELVSSPSVLFLDEPTSGLDSVSAWKILRILNAIASVAGKPTSTVICSIHQPSSEVFAEFSRVVILGQGHVIYQGRVQDLPAVLEAKGFALPPLSNPADFAMLCVQLNPLDALPTDNENKRAPRRAPELVVSKSAKEMIEVTKSASPPGMLVQSYEVAKREARALVRDKQAIGGRLATTLILNVLIAIIFSHTADQHAKGYTAQNELGSLIMVLMIGFFMAAQPAMLTIPVDKVIALREMSSNMYGILPYALSKLLVELPVNFLFAILTFLIVYWAIGFTGNFMLLVVNMFLLMETGVSTAYLIGAIAGSPEQAVELGPLIIMPQFFFVGLFVAIANLPTWLQWPQWLCSLKYGINIMMVAEFNLANCATKDVCDSWNYLLTANSVQTDATWWYALVLIGLFFGLRLIALGIIYAKSLSMR